jgi:catechol 2,3-dioxygenase-like lactoylglutathione lyase family enzyme
MDALHPRLLVADFGAAFRFYDRVLPELLGATLTRGGPEGPYASWDVGGEGLLTLLERAAMAEVAGTGALPTASPTAPPATQDRAMLVSRVPDVAAAYDLALRHGGAPVAPPAARPAWGPTMRTAHLRDPEGNLLEFQSY